MRLSLSDQKTLRANLNKNRIKLGIFNRSKGAFAVRGVCFVNLANKIKQNKNHLTLVHPV